MSHLPLKSIISFTLIFLFFSGCLGMAAEKEVEITEGQILLQDDAWQRLMEEPANKFQLALDSFLNNDLQNAALNIRQAATIVNIEVTRSQKDIRKELQSLAGELVILSKKIKSGKVSQSKELEILFYKTEKLFARHKLQNTNTYFKKGMLSKVAYALEAAARHLIFSQLWAEKPLSVDKMAQLKELHKAMLTMINTETFAKKKMEAFKKDLDSLIAAI
ncbi:MAG: hypothetical protein KQH63_10660 [Desulfobulbaceae bacterium]|nr:hypothetical protein [Desulfobulbaceae bacterium]